MWVTKLEIEKIATVLGMTVVETIARFTRRIGGRMTIIERADNHDCIFLTPDGKGGKGCSVYENRPMQCRTWPFWRHNLNSVDSWCAAAERCPGINFGQLHAVQHIEACRDATAS